MDLGSSFIHIISPIKLKEVINQCYMLKGLIRQHEQKLSELNSKSTPSAILALKKMDTMAHKRLQKLKHTLNVISLPNEGTN